MSYLTNNPTPTATPAAPAAQSYGPPPQGPSDPVAYPSGSVYGNNDPAAVQASVAASTAAQQQPQSPAFNYDLNGVNPANDLQYNSFLRGYGLDSSTAQAQADYTRRGLEAQLAAGIPGIEQQRQEGIVNDKEAAANRGAARSSSNLLTQDQTNRTANSNETALRQGIADKEAQASFGLQDTLNQLQRQKSEQELQARQRLLDVQNQQAAMNYVLQQNGLQ